MKVFFVYMHLLAVCIAVGSLLRQDFELIRKKGNALSNEDINSLQKTAKIMIYSLSVLWMTGLGLVYLGWVEKPDTYLTNQKLWAKFTVVFALTVNGYLLHAYSFPRLTSCKNIFSLTWDDKVLIGLTGVLSTVSWLFASYLGIARHWNYTAQYSYVMSIFILIVVLSFIGFILLVNLYHYTNKLGGLSALNKYSGARSARWRVNIRVDR